MNDTMITKLRKVFLATSIAVCIMLCTWTGFGYHRQSTAFDWLMKRIYEPPILAVRSCNATEDVQFDNFQVVANNHTRSLFITATYLSDGRLGNQMFRYASLFGIAHAQGRTLIVPPGSELGRTFKLHHEDFSESAKTWTTIGEDNALAFSTKLMQLPEKNIKVYGFLQSYKYFASIPHEIRCEYTFQDYVAGNASLILQDVRAKFKNSVFVGVHLRRGDFTTDRNQRLGYAIPNKSYFDNAFNLIKSRLPGRSITFLVASDDLKWCKENLVGNNVVILPAASAAIHLAILASCDHVIISGGTYSWWSGFLSGDDVIYFSGYLPKNTTFGDEFCSTDYYPEDWTGLGN